MRGQRQRLAHDTASCQAILRRHVTLCDSHCQGRFDGDGFVFQHPAPVFRLSSMDNRGRLSSQVIFFSPMLLCN